MKEALVLGGNGFIGWHLVKRLKENGFWVRSVDILESKYEESYADENIIADLRELPVVKKYIDRKFDYIFQLAADMGGAGYINGGDHDAKVLTNNSLINLNTLKVASSIGCKKIFFSSSACVYNSDNINEDFSYSESAAYPAFPENEYGWEKLFFERVYFTYNKMYGMQNKIARFHNIFGENGTYSGGREKCLAAICRKVASANDGDSIEVWGDGEQTRSFLHVSHCVTGILKLMESETFNGPVNIGSSYMISINQLIELICEIANKKITVTHISGPKGANNRNSDNFLIMHELNWEPPVELYNDVAKTYFWIEKQLKKT